ncbi:MAG: UbiA family prenyltransferase [Cyclobacteriaceae bacterium]|jgi:1,4-dihydroxy-2-naphthoate octaprenyltransferase|nr:ubiquinone biosynthesis protein UbiA [Cytophagales bacterium]HNP75969.1 UbiA family prenyltransferase [Cyclobacteriaceae bacterium]
MIYKSTLLHLRIPFSFFLMPVFLFALAISPNLGESRLKWAFIIIHLLLYPASNGFNSYFDKDEKSIGGLKNPPPVSKELYWTSLLLDVMAIVLGFLCVSYWFSMMLLIYGLVSKAYSHPSIRLKKYPILGWLVTGVFQGFFTFCMCYIGINNYEPENLLHLRIIFPAALTTLMLWANYPMTQVYQHEEDEAHGDYTLSRRLGIRGTFIFAAVFFGVTTVGFLLYFRQFQLMKYGITFLQALTPVVLYFGYWFLRVWQNPARADYGHAMRLNFISALCLNIFFVWLFLSISHIGEYLF